MKETYTRNYLGESIECVDIHEYRWNGHVFQSLYEAKNFIRDFKHVTNAQSSYGYLYLTDPFDDLERYGILHGIRV